MSNQYNELLIRDVHRETNGETLDAEKNVALFNRIVAGDTAARREMILGNVPLAVAKVESFIRCFPEVEHLRDDLTSAAFVGLTKAVNQMAEGCRIKQPENWTPTDCRGAWIIRELGRLTEIEAPIHVPQDSARLAKQKGEPIPVPVVQNVIPERFEVPSYEKELETRDLIEACCRSPEERTLVAMREAGQTYAEIAKVIGRPLSSTYAMAKQLHARVHRKLEALRDA